MIMDEVTASGTLIVGIIGGIGAALTYILFKVASVAGSQLKLQDFLPAEPPNPPIPKFMTYNDELKRQITDMFKGG